MIHNFPVLRPVSSDLRDVAVWVKEYIRLVLEM